MRKAFKMVHELRRFIIQNGLMVHSESTSPMDLIVCTWHYGPYITIESIVDLLGWELLADPAADRFALVDMSDVDDNYEQDILNGLFSSYYDMYKVVYRRL
jgi:hypothetical protein